MAFIATTVCRRIFGSMWLTVVINGAGGDGGDMLIVGAAKAKSKFNIVQLVPRATADSKPGSGL